MKITIKSKQARKKWLNIMYDVFNFIFSYIICGAVIILLMRHFIFGYPVDRLNVTYSIASGIGLATARIIMRGIYVLSIWIRVWLLCTKSRIRMYWQSHGKKIYGRIQRSERDS